MLILLSIETIQISNFLLAQIGSINGKRVLKYRCEQLHVQIGLRSRLGDLRLSTKNNGARLLEPVFFLLKQFLDPNGLVFVTQVRAGLYWILYLSHGVAQIIFLYITQT